MYTLIATYQNVSHIFQENPKLYIIYSIGSLFNAFTVTQTITTLEEAKRFVADCMKAVGAPEGNASTLAENLITADHRGFYTHGMNRLGIILFLVVCKYFI